MPLYDYNSDLMPLASAMTWVENILNLTNNYYKATSSDSEGDQLEYLVPFPPGYTSTMKAQWITDVIVLDPSCSWQNATRTFTGNTTDYYGNNPGSLWDVTLLESNLTVHNIITEPRMFLLSFNIFMCLLDSQQQAITIRRKLQLISLPITKVQTRRLRTAPYFLS